MLHLHQIKSQASPYWDSLVRIYHTSFPVDEQRPIESIAHLIEHDERFVAYAIVDEDENENRRQNESNQARLNCRGVKEEKPASRINEDEDDTPSASLVPLKEGQCSTHDTLNSKQNNNDNEDENYDECHFEHSEKSRKVRAELNGIATKVSCSRSFVPQDDTQSAYDPDGNTKHYALNTTQENLLGLLTTWHFEEFIYIEHFAIDPDLRSRGYGAEALKTFIAQQQCPIVLEAEPPTDKLSTRRIRFYERCGLTLYDFPYIQPAYTPESNPVELRLMGTLNTDDTPLALVSKILHREVYGLRIND